MMKKFKGHDVLMGMDANSKLSGLCDYHAIGPGVPEAALTAEEMQRAVMVHDFLSKTT